MIFTVGGAALRPHGRSICRLSATDPDGVCQAVVLIGLFCRPSATATENRQSKGGASPPSCATSVLKDWRAAARNQQHQKHHQTDDEQHFGDPSSGARQPGKTENSGDDCNSQKRNGPYKHGVLLLGLINAPKGGISPKAEAVPIKKSVLNQMDGAMARESAACTAGKASRMPDTQASSRSLNNAGVRPWRCSSRYTSVRLRPASRATSLTWPRVSFSSEIR